MEDRTRKEYFRRYERSAHGREVRRKYFEKYRREHGRAPYRDQGSKLGTRAIPLTYSCEICKRRKKRTVRHHIIPRSEGGSNEASNLIEVCKFHHECLEALYYDFKRKIHDANANDRKSYAMKVYSRNRRRYAFPSIWTLPWKPLFPKLSAMQSYAIKLRRKKILTVAQVRNLTSDGHLKWFSDDALRSVPEFRLELLRFIERHRNTIVRKTHPNDRLVFDTIKRRLVDGVNIEKPVETEFLLASDTLLAIQMLFMRRKKYHAMFYAFTKPLKPTESLARKSGK